MINAKNPNIDLKNTAELTARYLAKAIRIDKKVVNEMGLADLAENVTYEVKEKQHRRKVYTPF